MLGASKDYGVMRRDFRHCGEMLPDGPWSRVPRRGNISSQYVGSLLSADAHVGPEAWPHLQRGCVELERPSGYVDLTLASDARLRL